MAINLAKKFSPKVVERFALRSLTDAYAGHDYKFNGVSSVTVYTIESVPLTSYSRSASTNRFGTLTELQDTTQEMIMTQDDCFQRAIDSGNAVQQLNIKSAARFLKRQQDEVITPKLDTYRLGKWAAGAGTTKAEDAAPTKDNILEQIFTGSTALSNALVPKEGRALFIKESVYLMCKLAPMINNLPGMGEKALKRGSVGMLDKMNVVPVPDSMMPENTNFIIKAAHTTVDPVQLKTMRILDDQMEVDGQVVQGRIIYDSFVLTTKNKGIYTSTYTAGP